jgi:hypothetical protein
MLARRSIPSIQSKYSESGGYVRSRLLQNSRKERESKASHGLLRTLQELETNTVRSTGKRRRYEYTADFKIV